jgi:hypothetical protein
MVVVGLALLAGTSARVEARGGDWVPKRAWRAVKKAARQQYSPAAKLSKTPTTIEQSRGLNGQHGKAWIVRATAPTPAPRPGGPSFVYHPEKVHYLVTKNAQNRWQATQLNDIGGYLNKVDANRVEPVRAAVGLGAAASAATGVKVQHATALQVTQGTQLAAKRNDSLTQTVYLKGAAASRWGMSSKATVEAKRFTGWGHPGQLPTYSTIPVDISNVMFALGQR